MTLTGSFTVPAPFSTGVPFSPGGAGSDLVPSNFPVSIGGHPYMVDWPRYERQTVESQRPAFDNQAEPGEQTLNPQNAWRRSQSRFDLGAGQLFFDDQQADNFLTSRVGNLSSTSLRYYASKGIDPWEDSGIRLLPAVASFGAFTETNLQMLVIGNYLYVIAGDVIGWYNATTGALIDSETLPADPISVTTDGTNIYLAYGPGTDADYFVINSPTNNAFGTLEPSLLRYSNGRMIAVEAGDLWEYDNLGAHVGTVLVSPDFGGTWVDVVGTPVGIFAALNVGDYRGELYMVTVDPDTGGLLPGRFAGRLPNGETFNSLYFYGSVIIAGTSLGIRVFELTGQDQNSTVMNPLVEIPGGVTAMAGVGEFVWFGWTNYDSTSTGLGRMNVARTTDPDAVVPPYASDLMATAQGEITSVAISPSDGRALFAVSNVGFFGAALDGELVASGTFDSGWVRYGSLIEKAYSGVELVHDPLNGTVEVALTNMAENATDLGVSDTEGTTFSEVFSTQVRARAVRVRLTLNRHATTDTLGPVVRNWTLLAFPAPARSDEIILPIVMRELVKDLQNGDYFQDLVSEHEFLDGLARSGQFVTYREYDLTEQVILKQVLLPPDEDREGAVSPSQDTRRWHQGVWLVRMATKEN
jgi:hypothetical protein